MKLTVALSLFVLFVATVIAQNTPPVLTPATDPTKTPTPSKSTAPRAAPPAAAAPAVAAPAAPAPAAPTPTAQAKPPTVAAAPAAAAPAAPAAPAPAAPTPTAQAKPPVVQAKPPGVPPQPKAPTPTAQPKQPSQTPKPQQQQPQKPASQPQDPNPATQVKPSPSGAAPVKAATASSLNALQILSKLPTHTVFVNMVRKANMTNVLSTLSDITVLAPTNAGFLATLRDLRYKKAGDPDAVKMFWEILLNDEASLNITTIVQYHIGRQRLNQAQIEARRTRFADSFIATLSGNKIEIKNRSLKDNAFAMPNPNFVSPLDVSATNAYIHSLDRMLIPTNISRAAVTARVVELQKTFQPKRKVCFPLSATVRSADGVSISMHELKAGQHIHVTESGDASAVFLFSHRTAEGMHDFVRLTTVSGHSIALSPGHYLYVNGRLTAASAARIGDTLRTVSGHSEVAAVDMVRERGLVAPHTIHGDMVVDGIVASSYTTAVHPRLAQIMLAPVRAVVRMGLATEPLGAVLYNGADNVANFLPGGPDRY